MLLAMKPKGDKKKNLVPMLLVFSPWCKGRQISLSLVRKHVSTVSPNSTKDHTGTKIQNESSLIERVGKPPLLEICSNILVLYDAITFPPALPGTILTSCPRQSKSLG